MKILVTGGSGFIGTRLVGELLRTGHHVTIFDKNDSSKYPELVDIGDVRDKEALIRVAAGQDVIYHLAAEHADNVRPESLYWEVNVNGAKNLVDAAKNAGINKIIFTSSVAVYPLNASEADEDSKPAPFNEYGRSKYATVRPCVIFGEENRGNVYNLLRQIYRKRFIMVGSGRNKKSMGYVGNLVEFLIFALDFSPGPRIFNYADKPDLTTNEIIRIAKDAFGKNGDSEFRIPYGIGLLGGYAFDVLANISGNPFSISSIRIKKFCADTTISTNRLLKTGFKPPYTLKEALEQTIKAEFASQSI